MLSVKHTFQISSNKRKYICSQPNFKTVQSKYLIFPTVFTVHLVELWNLLLCIGHTESLNKISLYMILTKLENKCELFAYIM